MKKASKSKKTDNRIIAVLQYALDNLDPQKVIFDEKIKRNELRIRNGYEEFRKEVGLLLSELHGIKFKVAKQNKVQLDEILRLKIAEQDKSYYDSLKNSYAIWQTADALQTK